MKNAKSMFMTVILAVVFLFPLSAQTAPAQGQPFQDLQDQINQVAQDQAAGDQGLQDQIDQEKQVRADADQDLQDKIDAIGLSMEHVSLNGCALVVTPLSASGGSKELGYLISGEAVAFEEGDVFSFAPIQLPDGANIKSIKCVVKDNTDIGYITANLLRGPINTIDPVIPPQVIAAVRTLPSSDDSGYIEIEDAADPNVAVVDNTAYGYFFSVTFLDNPLGAVGDLRLRGCIVELQPF